MASMIDNIYLECLTLKSLGLDDDDKITADNMEAVRLRLEAWEGIVIDVFCCSGPPRKVWSVGSMIVREVIEVNHALIQVAGGGGTLASKCTARS